MLFLEAKALVSLQLTKEFEPGDAETANSDPGLQSANQSVNEPALGNNQKAKSVCLGEKLNHLEGPSGFQIANCV